LTLRSSQAEHETFEASFESSRLVSEEGAKRRCSPRWSELSKQSANTLRERAAETSSLVASELDH